jgi:hypothetical protein
MTFGILDCWGKKNSHMKLQQKTQNHTHQTVEKHKIAHQKTKNHKPGYQNQTPKLQQKTKNHIVPDCRKKNIK